MRLKRHWCGSVQMTEASEVVSERLAPEEKVVLGCTHASALLGLDQTSKAEAKQHEVDDHSHCDGWIVLLRRCSVGGRRSRCWCS